MDKRTYAFLTWVYIGLLVLLVRAPNPYGGNFLATTIPALLVLTSLQWLLLSKRLGWFASVLYGALAAAIMIELSRLASRNPRELVLRLLGALAVQLAVLLILSVDNQTRRIAPMVTVVVAFIISIGAYLTSLAGDYHFPRTGLFLFWSPLVAISIWINGVASGWTKYTQIVFICLIAQNGIGFFDLGTALHKDWMHGLLLVFVLLALCFIIVWADDLNKNEVSGTKG